jgi:hypothetical protein
MQKREKVIFAFLGMLVLNILVASATIEITQPLETYNFGDSIFTTVTLNPQTVSGSFEINLFCENKTANFYKIAPADGAFSANKEQKINHKITLTKEFIENLSGKCKIIVILGKESISSNEFLLTKEITLTTKTDKAIYNPGEKIIWSLEAQKANEMPLNGFVEISSNITNSANEVIGGKATNSFTLENNARAGRYELSFFAYDKDENGILNEKRQSLFYDIRQVPTKIEASMSSLEATPGQSFEFGVDLFDQSNEKMPGTLSSIYTSEKNDNKQISAESGSVVKIDFAQNATPGKYSLVVSQGNLKTTKEFSLKEVPKLDIQFLENSSILLIRNIGNVIYNNSLDVELGGKITKIELNLAVGEEKKFNIRAPDGSYDVTATSGDSTTKKNLLLTGDVISIREGSGTIIFEASPYIWFFIVSIFLLLGTTIFMKNKKRTFKSEERYGNVVEERPTLEQVSKKAHMQKQYLDLSQPRISEAESNISMTGSKDFCSIVSLNIKNSNVLGTEGNSKINEILTEAKSRLGVVDWKSQHALIIFSPLLTKTYNNEILAAKTAFEIKTKIDEYNKRFKDKIVYNIGIHAGEMINTLINGKLNYTSLGNTIILARRISDLTNEKLLVSGTFRQKLLRELKVQKIEHKLGDVEIYEVQRIADIAANEEKLKQLLKRTNFS